MDQDLWGGYLNTDLDDIDGLMLTATNTLKNNQTAGYNVQLSDRNKIILCDATGAAFQISLISAATAGNGFEVTIKKTDSSSNTITIDGDSSETIDGDTTLVITTQYVAITLVCDGINWFRKNRSAAVTPKFVNIVSSYLTTTDSTAVAIPRTDVKPTTSQGKEYITVAIAPTSVSSTIKGWVTMNFGSSVNNHVIEAAVFADAGTDAIAVGAVRVTDSSDTETLVFPFEHSPATLSSVTYRVRFGPDLATTTAYVNRNVTGRVYGGAMSSGIVVQEIS